MNKLMLGTFSGIFLLLGMVIIYYWRDIQYDPSALDLVSYFFILPVLVSLILLAPYFIYQAYPAYIRRREQRNRALLEQQQLNKAYTDKEPKVEEIKWFNLNVFSAFACHAFGENETIIEGLENFKTPGLDYHLENSYGLPVLSYRIQKLDHILELADDEQNEEDEAGRVVRIKALIQQQLEQQTEILSQVAEHLKQSALFYDSELAYQYRMHSAWSTLDAPTNDQDDQDISIEQVPRLNRLNIHFLLSDNLLQVWDEHLTQEIVLHFIESLGILSQQIHLQPHYIAQQNAYTYWLKLLEKISAQSDQFSLLINVDSEIDQTLLDEKMWLKDDYLAAEFSSSWCVAAADVKINNIEAIKIVKVASNVDDLAICLNQAIPRLTKQIQQEQPFVLVLDDVTDIKSIKKNNQKFAPALIEPYHFLYTKLMLGHTQHLAKIFGFMLGMHLPDEMTAMIYSSDQVSSYAFFQTNIAEN
ncbi:hypothetical protein B9T26_01800 [Acinetobacter sp. ANC 4169]|uniref:hypothetical protein n=1 Tax=Acinetobacter sp. ANC 4169 TaxID=1977879 RepID=UPI000A349032|nr:hypothetical protein [Acinetobacter sp. ANC 4169]OTG76567.1 hypothetical protein B9T26_01800 [Acinetobacter sp. ANC 4169]